MGKYDQFRQGSLFAESLRDVEEGLSQFEEDKPATQMLREERERDKQSLDSLVDE